MIFMAPDDPEDPIIIPGPIGPQGPAGTGGGGSTTISQVMVNLGAIPVTSGSFQIAGSGLTIGKPVSVAQAIGPYTNKGTLYDEIEMGAIVASGVVLNATTIQVNWSSFRDVVANFVQFNYWVSA